MRQRVLSFFIVLFWLSNSLAATYPCTGVPTKKTVNIRESASIKSKKVGEVTSDMELTVLGEEVDNEGLIWYRIQTPDGKQSFISSRFLSIKDDDPSIASPSQTNTESVYPSDPFSLLKLYNSTYVFDTSTSALDIKNLFQQSGFSINSKKSTMPLWSDEFTNKFSGHNITCENNNSSPKDLLSFFNVDISSIDFYCSYDFSDGEIKNAFSTGQSKTTTTDSKLYYIKMLASEHVTKADYDVLKAELTSRYGIPHETSNTITSTVSINNYSKKSTYNQIECEWKNIWCYPQPVAIKMTILLTKDNKKLLDDGFKMSICYLGREEQVRTYGN